MHHDDFDDNYIASLIARGCKGAVEPKRKYECTTVDINKNFLRNTILSTESHNKREEIADCWRELETSKLTKKLRLVDHEAVETAKGEYKNQREFWANEKASRLAIQQYEEINTSPRSKKSSKKKNSKDKKDKKEKKKLKEKKAKKKLKKNDKDKD